jgi:hypothetical protein
MSDVVERLLKDSDSHYEVARSADMRPEDTLNWEHGQNCQEAADTITRLTAENKKLKAALVRWLDAVNDKRALEHHQPDNLGKEWSRRRQAVDLAEDNARAALS